MGELGRIVVFVMTFISCNALLDLSGVHQVTGIWMGSTTLPCTYVPSEGFTERTLSWRVERDSSISTVFRRDDSGDHILLSKFRGRVSVPKDSPGNASLLIENLEMPDSGHYTCQVTWRSPDNSLMTREVTTTVKVVKVAATKPTIRVGELGLTVPAGASTNMTCEASGSPPIRYRWFRGNPAGKPTFLSSGAELALLSLQPSDSGMYFCEAENRAGDGAVQRSDAVQLTVTDLPIAVTTSKSGMGYPGKNDTLRDSQRTGLSLYLVILIAVVCGAVVFLLISLIICIRRPKDARIYDVIFRKSRVAASSSHDSTCHYEEPIPSSENDYVMEPRENKISEEANKNVSDCVGNPQESEYEVGDNS